MSKLMQLIQTKYPASIEGKAVDITEYWTPEGQLVDQIARPSKIQQMPKPAVLTPEKPKVTELPQSA
jgi:hypothetical protein